MKYIFLILLLIINLEAIEYYINSNDKHKLAFMDKAKNQIRFNFDKDVRFKNIYYNRGVTGIELVCGKHTKTKNSMLFYDFIYVSPNFIFFQNETRNFDKIWDQLCKYDNRKTSVFAK